MRELGQPDGFASSDLLGVGDVLLELAELGAVPVNADEVDIGAKGVEECLQQWEAGCVGTFLGGDGGGAEEGFALEGFHVCIPAVDDLLGGHAAAAGAGGLLRFVEGEQVRAAGGDGGLRVGGPAGEGAILVVVKHGHELDA